MPGRRKGLAVVLASAGRSSLLADAMRGCRDQKDVDFVGVVSVPDEESLPDDRSLLDGWLVVTGTRGLAAQRNAGLEAVLEVGGSDLVAFFDDDAVLRSDYLARAAAFMAEHPDVLGLTGRVLLDGKITGEIGRAEADEALNDSRTLECTGAWRPTRELYGANFVVRSSAVPDLRFDDRLPLYSWLEDHDFARRLMAYGPLASVDDCVIVHRAAASGGRRAHLRLGYSQVMNPVHLLRAGSFPMWLVVQQIGRPAAKNLALSVVGPERVWRRVRLRGNALAAADVIRGRVTPGRITEL